MPDRVYDVIVVGAGNAALSAAIAARERSEDILVVEKAPEYFRGGNTYFTGGIIRFAFDGIDDIKALIPDMSDAEESSIEVGSYTEDDYYDDMMRVTHGLTDPELAQILVSQSHPTMKWLQEHGVRFVLSFGRQAFKDGDKFRFWGGLVVEAVGAGKGLSDQQFDVCQRMGVDVPLRHPRASTSSRTRRDGSAACGCWGPTASRTSRPVPLYWPRADSRPTPRCAAATSAPAGRRSRCGASPTTPATASAWPSTWAPSPTATGAAATRWPGT